MVLIVLYLVADTPAKSRDLWSEASALPFSALPPVSSFLPSFLPASLHHHMSVKKLPMEEEEEEELLRRA